jgi:hypothetical protein
MSFKSFSQDQDVKARQRAADAEKAQAPQSAAARAERLKLRVIQPEGPASKS